jgi:GAF domain-containing protein
MRLSTSLSKSSLNNIYALLSRIGAEICKPHHTVIDLVDREQVQLAACLSLTSLFFALISAIFLVSTRGFQISNLILLGTMLVQGIAYFLLRSRFLHLGKIIFVITVSILGYLSGFIFPDISIITVMGIISLGIIFTTLLLPVVGQLSFTIINSVISFMYPTVNKFVDPINMHLISFIFFTFGLVMILVNLFRNRLKNMRINELEFANNELIEQHRILENKLITTTTELQLASELGQILSQVKDKKSLLPQSVQMIRDRFDLYYAQIYLTDPQNKYLILQAGSGRIGDQLLQRGHRLPINENSLNGQAAFEMKPVIVPDTSKSLSFRVNPLLPNTRSEMCIPLIVEDRVVGVLDIQSSIPEGLSEDSLPAFTSLAVQLAIAIENTSLYEQTLESTTVTKSNPRQSIGEGWQEYLNAIDKPEQIIRTYSQGSLHVDTQPLAGGYEQAAVYGEDITIAGVKIGTIQLAREQDHEWNDDDKGIIHSVASQVALQINNLRLLEQSNQYRNEAEKATMQATRTGWQSYLAQSSENQLAFIYDQHVVEQLGETSTVVDTGSIYSEELSVRNVTIGELAIIGLNDIDEDAREFVRTISENLSAHLENLRLSEQTQSALAETNTLYNIISQLNAARDYESIITVLSEQTILSGADKSLIMFKFDRPLDLNSNPEWVMPIVFRANTEIKISDRYPLNAFQVEPDTLFTKTTVVINDVGKDGRLDRITRTLFQDVFHAESSIIIPLLVGNQSIGFIMGNFGRQRAFNDAEILRLTTIANQVAIAVQGMQLLEQTLARARREQLLREVTNHVNSAAGTDAILRNAVEQVGRALKRPAYIFLGNEKTANSISSCSSISHSKMTE